MEVSAQNERNQQIPGRLQSIWAMISRETYKGKIFVLWVFLRVLVSFTAAIASYFRVYYSSGDLSAWNPNQNLGAWLYQVLVFPWHKWDTGPFAQIASQGYEKGLIQFHPLYSWLAVPLVRLGIDAYASLLIINLIASFLLFLAFYRLAREKYEEDKAFTSLILFVTFPAAYIILAPYSESVFLLFAILCIYMAQKQRWWLAGLLGMLATLTRQQGIFLVIPVLIEFLISHEKQVKSVITAYRQSLSILLIPFGFIFWIAYRSLILGDYQPDFTSFQTFIYSVVISPHTVLGDTPGNLVQGFFWPWKVIGAIFEKKPDLDLYTNIIAAGLFLLLFVISWKKLRTSHLWYSLAIILVSISYYTGPIHPVMGLPRHMFLAFPVFLGLVERLTKPWMRLLYVGVCVVGYIVLLWFHAVKAWIP